MKVSVVGSGYVGTTTSALLAMAGHDVTAIDVDQSKVDTINAGKAPFYEAGLDLLLAYAVKNGTLTASSSTDSLAQADVIFSCVGTPDNPDGSPNVSYINQVAESVAEHAQDGAIFVQKSTVPVGTGERLGKVVASQTYVSNPEFLREGTAIADSLFFDRIVIGCDDKDASQKVADLFASVSAVATTINGVAELGLDDDALRAHVGQTIFTGVNSAELIKVTANAFLALKISFANSAAKLADRSGADIGEVMDGIGSDARIGRAFLNAGHGYGGGCFPKDVSGLISVAIDHGVDFSIMTAATDTNASMPGYIVSKVQETAPVKDAKVAVLGLAFKPGTSDARKSPAVALANVLAKEGAHVTGYDPEAKEEAREELRDDVTLVDSAAEALKDAEITFVATKWDEFRNMTADDFKQQMSGTIIVDSMNSLDKAALTAGGLTYIGVGR